VEYRRARLGAGGAATRRARFAGAAGARLALVYALLGLTPEAGAIYTLCTALGEFFHHTNVTTPP